SESDLADPIGDDRHSPVKGIVHRHNDRVLLKLVHLCAVYCRFCFRRETLGSAQSKNLSEAELETALDYIRRNEEIWEVLLTGGDPLVLAPRRLQRVIGALAAISHVKIIRIHTRVPVVDPSRIDDEMVAALTSDKPVYVVLHANHARELTPNAKAAIAKLAFAGVPLLSQSVLLRGVNDSEEALKDLFRALLENRVKPYYLHHGDLARGTSHFRTTIEEGQRLFGALRAKISGIGLPRYVLDIPGGWGKVSIEASHLTATPDGYLVRDDAGQLHEYRCM
ncbi:MAG TPA: lysine-2,3-aminomutase-like protein, partial [Rhizomicrobium sp.]|nr:lysine-2,3-aminomutase-like protein [Rhizomicrobium sp.]